MSSLMVAQDQRIIMLEFAIDNLYVPRTTAFDEALLKKVTIMFRFLDEEWTELTPNRRDHRSYRGSNYENEKFYGGRSVVFAVPEATLEKPMHAIDVQVYVFKNICKYFEMDSCENVGFTVLRVDRLLNAIVKDLNERKELQPYLCGFHEGDPISRSIVGKCPLLNEEMKRTSAFISFYLRITYLGNCVITEIQNCLGTRTAFHAKKDDTEETLYQLRELNSEDLRTGSWGSTCVIIPPVRSRLTCYCEKDMIEKCILEKLMAIEEAKYEKRRARVKKAGISDSGKGSKPKKSCSPDRDRDIPANIEEIYRERLEHIKQLIRERLKFTLGGQLPGSTTMSSKSGNARAFPKVSCSIPIGPNPCTNVTYCPLPTLPLICGNYAM